MCNALLSAFAWVSRDAGDENVCESMQTRPRSFLDIELIKERDKTTSDGLSRSEGKTTNRKQQLKRT